MDLHITPFRPPSSRSASNPWEPDTRFPSLVALVPWCPCPLGQSTSSKLKTLTSEDPLRRTLEIYALVLLSLTLPAGCHPFSAIRPSLKLFTPRPNIDLTVPAGPAPQHSDLSLPPPPPHLRPSLRQRTPLTSIVDSFLSHRHCAFFPFLIRSGYLLLFSLTAIFYTYYCYSSF